MAKSLNQFDLKDAGGTGKAGQAVNTNNRKKNLPDLTTSFANALTQGADSLTKPTVPQRQNQNSTAIYQGAKKAVSTVGNAIDKVTAQYTPVATSSLVGSNATPEEKAAAEAGSRYRSAVARSGMVGGMANALETAQDIANMTKPIQAAEQTRTSNREMLSRGYEPETTYKNFATDAITNGVKQLTKWSYDQGYTDQFIQALEPAKNSLNAKAEEITNQGNEYAQMLTPFKRNTAELLANVEQNVIRDGIAMATGNALGAGAGIMSDLMMGLPAYGEALKSAREKGLEGNKARQYALLQAGIEVGSEHMFDIGGVNGYSLGLEIAIADAIDNSSMRPGAKYIMHQVASVLTEGGEEFFASLARDATDRQMLGQEKGLGQSLEDAGSAFLQGAMSALLLSGIRGNFTQSGYNQYKADLAVRYLSMSDYDKTSAVNRIAEVYNVDPAMLEREIDTQSREAIKGIDPDVLYRALNHVPVAVLNNGESVYDYVGQVDQDKKNAMKMAERLGDAYLVEDLGDDERGRPIAGVTLDDGKVLVSARAEDPVSWVMAHEGLHQARGKKGWNDFVNDANLRMRDVMGESFQRWFDNLNANYAKFYANVAAPDASLTDAQVKDYYTEEGRKLYETDPSFRGKMDEEVAAYYVQKNLLHSDESMRRFLNSTGNVAQKVYQALRDTVGGFGKTLTDEEKTLADMEKRFGNLIRENEMEARTNVGIADDGSAYQTMYSRASWEALGDEGKRQLAADIAEQVGTTIDVAQKWMDDINSVAAMIGNDATRLDYIPNNAYTAVKTNDEYLYTVDMSTLCKKRILLSNTIDEIQKMLPGVVLTGDDYIRVREMMKDRGYEVSCGFCYVESRRKQLGDLANQFIDALKGRDVKMNTKQPAIVERARERDNYIPTLWDLTSADGSDALMQEHPEIYSAFVDFNATRGSGKVNLIETRTEYNNEIAKFTQKTIDELNARGGLRLQSYSDFETPHLIDMMQVVADMSRMGLMSQAFTKVPNFADAFGDTGIKINESLVVIGVDENGKLIFDDVEGMPHEIAFTIRQKHPENVGTIIVGKNDETILAAFADPRIDFIIPFHKSGWANHEYEALGIAGYDDYTKWQNERDAVTGKGLPKSKGNILPSEYWDYSVSGDENAKTYLRLCEEQGRIPKFDNFLTKDDAGHWVAPSGYWKTLIDFKMYDNDGVGVPQRVVTPTFDNEVNQRILDEYEGDHNKYSPKMDIVNEFIREKGYGERYSLSDDYMDAVNRGDMAEADKIRLQWANERGYTDRGYHGTQQFGFTVPDTKYSDDGRSFFVTDDSDTAATYSAVEGTRPISDAGTEADKLKQIENEWDRIEKEYDDSAYAFAEALNHQAGYYNYISAKDIARYIEDYVDSEDYLIDVFTDLINGTREDYDYDGEDEDFWDSEEVENLYALGQEAAEKYKAYRDFKDEAEGMIELLGDTAPGNYDVLINPTGLLNLDARNRNWDRLAADMIQNEDAGWLRGVLSEKENPWTHVNEYNTRQLAEYADAAGYPGYKISNVYDNGGKMGRLDHPSTVYNLFNPQSQVKSNDTVTYDDNGNVIPLSERFNPNNPDMRYALGEQYPSWQDVPEQEGNWGYHAGDLGKAEPRGSQGYSRGTGHFGTGTYFVGNPSELRYGYSDRPVESADFSQYNLFNPQNSDDAYTLHEFLKAVDGGIFGETTYTDEQISDYTERASEAADSDDPELMRPLIEEGREMLGDYFQNALDMVNRWNGTKFSDSETWDSNTDEILPPVTNDELLPYGSDTLYAIMDSFNEYGTNGARGWFRNRDIINRSNGMVNDVARMLGVTPSMVRTLAERISTADLGEDVNRTDDSRATRFMKALGYEGVDTRNIPDFDNTRYGSVIYDLKGNDLERKQANGARFSLNEEIPEQANAFPDRNYPQDRSAMRTLGQISRERVAADPLTYESITPESFPVPDRIQDYLDLIEDEEDRKYGFDEAPEKELSDEDREMYKSIQGNKSGALQGFATPTQMFNNMVGKTGEQREFLRDRYERPMYDTKKEYNANREQRWTALENMIKETGIQANTPESAAVQWYGEKVKPNEQGETVPYTLNDLKREFPNKWEDIVKMEQFMRGMYDEYVGRINAALEQVYPNLEEKAQAQLESWRNKIRVYQDEIEMSRNPVANEYWQNEIAKLDKKIAKLEGDLESGEYFRNKRLNPRQDYFHHFQEVETKGIGGLKNILQASTLIDPQLVGKTEFTKPKSRWMNWLQKRGQGAYTADAVLGMGKYIDSAEYAIAFDPLIAQYRDEISNMVKATRDTKNANQLIQYLSSYTNQLAGKTASLDRTILDLLGEGNRGQLFNALAAINNRAKSNAVVGNVRSAIAQFFNIPNAMSIIKSNTAWAKGVRDYANAKLGNRELLDQSPFLQERYFDHNVDDLKARNTDWEKITGKIGDITNEMMTFGDREATELIWLAAYNEGIENGVSDPTYYADDLTRQSVAGRGIGEVPYNMKSKVASFFMPFQVETNNQWQNLKGMLKDKDAKGVFRLMLGAYLMNAMVKPLFNDGVLPDIIDVLVQGLRKLFDKDREESVGEIALDTGKRMAGEAVSFIPGTSLWLPAIMSSDSAEALFGDSDPTRYGTGTVGLSTITKTLADALDGDGQFDLMTPLLQLGLPYGGKQASRLYNTLQDMNILPSNGTMNTPFGGEKNPISGDYSKAGALKYQLPEEVDSFGDAAEIARAFLFGSNATNAAQEYFDTLKPVLNKTQVEKLKENPEVDPQTYIDYVHQANVDGKNGISQAEAYNWLSSHDLSDEEKNALWSMTNSAWTKTYDEYTPQNETIVENADTNGDGRVTQAEAYSWLSRQDDISDEEKNAMWDENGWSTSYDKYDKAHKGVLGYNRKTLTEAVDQDGNGMMKQQELYFWLQNQGYTEQEKADLWDLAGWKTDYQSYNNKMKSKTPTTETTRKVKSMDELMGKEAPKSPSGITNRKELLIAADSNNDGYMSQKEAYAYLSGTDLSEEEKEALWNLSNWKTSYQKYAQKNG